eukprot:764944-Hanusia_phi.AAC.9
MMMFSCHRGSCSSPRFTKCPTAVAASRARLSFPATTAFHATLATPAPAPSPHLSPPPEAPPLLTSTRVPHASLLLPAENGSARLPSLVSRACAVHEQEDEDAQSGGSHALLLLLLG